MKDNKQDSRRLTSRQVSIIRLVLECAPNPVTLAAIAEKLQTSTRTVLRELNRIEAWMNQNDFTFVRKPGVGLVIEEDAEHLQLMRELLDLEGAQKTFSRKERRRQILSELLCTKEPVKSYVFRSRFQISEGTLSADLDALEKWFSSFNLRLIRRPGVGVFLEGSEYDLRQAIANAALEFTDEGELLKLLRGDSEASKPSALLHDFLFGHADPEIVSFVVQILAQTEQKLGVKYTDSGYMALVVHLSLSIRRMLNGEKIEMNRDDLEDLRTHPEYSIAEEVAQSIQDRFQLTVPQAEVGFITMHLSSARVMPQSRRFQRQLRTVNTHQVVMSIVNSVEQELNLPFHTCTRMIEELTSHMDSMISRLSMNIHLDNTQVEEIQQNYPHIYAAVERACQVFKTSLQIQDVSPSEITFVAMHFVAAAETMQVERTRVSVAVVCPSGMGASRMLAANLMRSFHNIEVRQIVSAFSILPEKLRSDGIDLVISTVPLNIDFPVVCVNPIPQAQDVMLITQTVGRIRKMRKGGALPNQPQIVGRSPVTVASIEKMTRIGEEILQILSHFTWHALTSVQRTEELMGEAAGLFADSLLTRRIISNDLAQRESVASTYLPTMGIHLLHCRTSAIEHCRFGFLKLEHPISSPLGTVEGAVLLLSPQSGSSECVEVVSRLSMLLAEEERFLQALLAGDVTGGKALAEQALVKYYEQNMKRIGDGTV